MRRLVIAVAALGLLVGMLPDAHAASLYEKSVNLDESLRLAAILRAEGYDVVLTRVNDVFIPLETRSAISNGAFGGAGPHVFISVHNNASSNTSVSGTEVYAQVRNAWSAQLAGSVHNGVVASAGTKPRGVHQRANSTGTDYYAVLRNTRATAMIVEGGYMSNPAEARNLADPAYRQRVAQGIANGLRPHVVATPKATGAGPGAPTRPLNQPPTGLRSWKTAPGRVWVEWQTATGVTRYRVWRNGIHIGDIGPRDPLAASTTVGFPEDLHAGVHRYEVRAITEVEGQFVADSQVAATEVMLGWRVVIDPGHGGSDPGAVGAI